MSLSLGLPHLILSKEATFVTRNTGYTHQVVLPKERPYVLRNSYNMHYV